MWTPHAASKKRLRRLENGNNSDESDSFTSLNRSDKMVDDEENIVDLKISEDHFGNDIFLKSI